MWERSKRNCSQVKYCYLLPKQRMSTGPNSIPTSSTVTITCNEVVKDHLIEAQASDWNFSINPVVTERGAIGCKLTELVEDYALLNQYLVLTPVKFTQLKASQVFRPFVKRVSREKFKFICNIFTQTLYRLQFPDKVGTLFVNSQKSGYNINILKSINYYL